MSLPANTSRGTHCPTPFLPLPPLLVHPTAVGCLLRGRGAEPRLLQLRTARPPDGGRGRSPPAYALEVPCTSELPAARDPARSRDPLQAGVPRGGTGGGSGGLAGPLLAAADGLPLPLQAGGGHQPLALGGAGTTRGAREAPRDGREPRLPAAYWLLLLLLLLLVVAPGVGPLLHLVVLLFFRVDQHRLGAQGGRLWLAALVGREGRGLLGKRLMAQACSRKVGWEREGSAQHSRMPPEYRPENALNF